VEEIRPLDDPTISFYPVDSMVMDAVYWSGIQGYEGKVSDVWISLCRRSHSILEIGGNIGLFTVIGARVAKGAYTVVEPVPEIAAILRDNLRRNELGRVEVLEVAAVPDTLSRKVTLNIPDEGRSAPVGAHLTEGSEVAHRTSARVLTVDGVPFRSLIQARDLIKIDAEGIEFGLLSAAREYLVANRPSLVIEVLPESMLLSRFLVEIPYEVGYRFYVIPEYGSDQIVSVDPREFSAEMPLRYKSKDVVLTTVAL